VLPATTAPPTAVVVAMKVRLLGDATGEEGGVVASTTL
jgi:hypothetical protein